MTQDTSDDSEMLPERYTVVMDKYGLTPETMTDAGMQAGMLEEVGSCSLTPGDPSPCGRTPEGDLAYPVFKSVGILKAKRRTFAWLAHLVARAQDITRKPEPPFDDNAYIFMQILHEALPRTLFADSEHGKLDYRKSVKAVIDGDLDKLPGWIDEKG